MEWLRVVCTVISRDNFQLVQSCFVTYRQRLEEVVPVDEELLHKKIYHKYTYLDSVATIAISDDAVKQDCHLTALI